MKIMTDLVLLAALCSPAMAAQAASATPASFAALAAQAAAADLKIPAPVLSEVKAPPDSPWTKAAKEAFEREIDAGGLTGFADLKELPPGARRQLEKEWQTLPEGPGNSSEAFKLMVSGRTAFVVQSYIYSDSMRAYIFNAAGVLVAYGEGSIDRDFAWLPLPY